MHLFNRHLPDEHGLHGYAIDPLRMIGAKLLFVDESLVGPNFFVSFNDSQGKGLFTNSLSRPHTGSGAVMHPYSFVDFGAI